MDLTRGKWLVRSRAFFLMSVTGSSSVGNPTGSSTKGFSLPGCLRTWPGESRGLGDRIEPILRESPLIVPSLFRLGAGAENTKDRLRSSCESHRHRIHAVTQTRRGRAIVEHVS